MTEAASILALLSMSLLAASVAIWGNVLRGPLLQRLDGRRVSNVSPAKHAIQALVFAFGLSAVAAVLAILGWMFP